MDWQMLPLARDVGLLQDPKSSILGGVWLPSKMLSASAGIDIWPQLSTMLVFVYAPRPQNCCPVTWMWFGSCRALPFIRSMVSVLINWAPDNILWRYDIMGACVVSLHIYLFIRYDHMGTHSYFYPIASLGKKLRRELPMILQEPKSCRVWQSVSTINLTMAHIRAPESLAILQHSQ